MEQRVGKHMPVSVDTLDTTHEACQNEAVDVYRQTSIFDEKGTYASKLEVKQYTVLTLKRLLNIVSICTCMITVKTHCK